MLTYRKITVTFTDTESEEGNEIVYSVIRVYHPPSAFEDGYATFLEPTYQINGVTVDCNPYDTLMKEMYKVAFWELPTSKFHVTNEPYSPPSLE